jgi:hypothetical protein
VKKDLYNPNPQEVDEPYDKSGGSRSVDGYRLAGKGSQGGGSKPSNQLSKAHTGNSRGGSYPLKGSYPKSSQKIRG